MSKQFVFNTVLYYIGSQFTCIFSTALLILTQFWKLLHGHKLHSFLHHLVDFQLNWEPLNDLNLWLSKHFCVKMLNMFGRKTYLRCNICQNFIGVLRLLFNSAQRKSKSNRWCKNPWSLCPCNVFHNWVRVSKVVKPLCVDWLSMGNGNTLKTSLFDGRVLCPIIWHDAVLIQFKF